MASAVVVAAGSGKRIGGKIEKQFFPLKGVPIVVWTLRAFGKADSIDEIVLVVPKGRVPWVEKEVVAQHKIAKISCVVEGGAERQDSVHEGLSRAEGGLVAIHDAVRPFVLPALIDALVAEAEKWGAAIPAVKIKDTVKDVDGGAIKSTLNREGFWLAQTPQVFQYDLIRRAYDKAYEDGYYSTDDSALVERLGHEVRIVEGSYRNIKITTDEDLSLAEAILNSSGYE